MIVDAIDPNEPRPPIDSVPPPSSELRLGMLDIEKPPDAMDDSALVERLPVTAVKVFCTVVKICWFDAMIAAVLLAVVVACVNVAASITGTCASAAFCKTNVAATATTRYFFDIILSLQKPTGNLSTRRG
jgi:hypothetical protein